MMANLTKTYMPLSWSLNSFEQHCNAHATANACCTNRFLQLSSAKMSNNKQNNSATCGQHYTSHFQKKTVSQLEELLWITE